MNLREAIGEYVVAYMHYQEVVGMEGEGVEKIRRRFGEADERLDCVVEVAEAAMAYAEHGASNSVADVDECLGKLGRLWGVFLEARAKATKQS